MTRLSKNTKRFLSHAGEETVSLKDSLETVKILAAQANEKTPVVEEENKSLFGKLKDKVFKTDNLLRFGTYRFNFMRGGGGPDHFLYLQKFFEEHQIKVYDFECKVTSPYDFGDLHGQKVALVDGVLFFMLKIESDALRESRLIIYTPIWQRDKAKVILSRELLKHRPVGSLIKICTYETEDDFYDEGLKDREQFVRSEVYDYVDGIFNRMFNDKDWYLENGKRYKETFLLHGKPGTGKTSLYMHMAAKRNINVISCTPRRFVEHINYIRTLAKQDQRFPVMILIEDIDSCEELLLKEYKSKMMDMSPRENENEFSYSTFINALDGAEALDNIIICLSTNCKEKLIPSIYRIGRVDHQLELTPFTSTEIALRVNTELSDYIASFPDGTFSIANIIDLRFAKTKEEIQRLVEWIKE